MCSVLCLTETNAHGEAVLALTRLIMETANTARYLSSHGTAAMYSEFVTSGLKDDVALFDDIQRRIAERGTAEMPIEQSMKASVERYVRESKTTMDAARRSGRRWGPTYYDRLKALGEEDAYLYVQRGPSSAVHGDWSDLFRFHLQTVGNGYRPAYNRSFEERKLLNLTATLVCEAALAYVGIYEVGDSDLVRSLEDCIAAAYRAEDESGDFSTSATSADR